MTKRIKNKINNISELPSFQPVTFTRVHVKPLPNIIEGIGKVYWGEAGQRTRIPMPTRRQVYTRAHGHCEWLGCLATKNLEIHHINGDPSDHSPDNLILLCKKHHNILTDRQKPYFPKSKPFGVWQEF